jgi:hypothetical protein
VIYLHFSTLLRRVERTHSECVLLISQILFCCVISNRMFRGAWLEDQQHGYGVQRWSSGAIYCGKWYCNKEDGWGAYFCPSNTPSEQNPHSAQMLFLGEFQNGCPKDGMVIECMDFRKLQLESFAMQHGADAKDIHAQTFRVYEVSYDGVSAFWQLPVPKRKRGLFNLKFKTCDFELQKIERPLGHKRSLEEIWYKWMPKPKLKKQEDSDTLSNGNDDDKKKTAVTVESNPRKVERKEKFETLSFHGVCVRDRLGQFPCPTDGTLGICPGTPDLQKTPRNLSLVEFEAKFDPVSSNSPILKGNVKYAIPANESELCVQLILKNVLSGACCMHMVVKKLRCICSRVTDIIVFVVLY